MNFVGKVVMEYVIETKASITRCRILGRAINQSPGNSVRKEL
jgi:hypothetical protein